MKVLFLYNFYPQYLREFRRKFGLMERLSFREHQQIFFDDHFGWPLDLCRMMKSMGIDSEFIISNAEALQKKWAKEQNYNNFQSDSWELDIAIEQIRRFKPDILWLSSHWDYYGAFVQESLKYAGKVVAWVGSPFMKRQDVRGISVLITENPDTFKAQHNEFEKVIVTKPGFNPDIITKLGNVEKEYDVSFLGQLSIQHKKRAEFLAYLLENGINVNIRSFMCVDPLSGKLDLLRNAAWFGIKKHNISALWRYTRQAISPFRYEKHMTTIGRVALPALFGMDMFRCLAQSRIVLNVHIDVAGVNSGNMRMFEATGVGACLVTERGENLSSLFYPEKEVITYTDKEDMLAVIKRCVNDPESTSHIAEAGQNRTLREHTMDRMWQDICPAFK